MTTQTRHIVITGDIALDTNIYKGNRPSPEIKKNGTQIKNVKGGSYLLFEIISETATQKVEAINTLLKLEKQKSTENQVDQKKIALITKNLEKEKANWKIFNFHFGLDKKIFNLKNFPPSLRTFAAWGLKEFIVPKAYQKVRDEKTKAWKVTEMIGWGQDAEEKNESKSPESLYNKNILAKNFSSKILVFDDGGNAFRNEIDAWSDLLFEDSKSNEVVKEPKKIGQIILKTAYPLCHGNLFRELTSPSFKDKLTIITSIDEIRKEDVLISKGVSWEQTALDLVHELRNNKAISQLLLAKRLIVTLHSEGALYIEMDDSGEIAKCRLTFDPEFLEGEWVTASKIEGDIFGVMTCFTAAITYGYLEAMFRDKFEKDINIESTITRALSATRKYKITGHGKDEKNPAFPIVDIGTEIINPVSKFASAFVPIPIANKTVDDSPTHYWTILDGNYKASVDKKSAPLFDTAFRFAMNGNKELANTPFLKINNLTTYDRCEIEAIRNIRNLIFDYLGEDKPEKPLSLAVFGMPGSGKSFAVKQLAKSLALPFLEFNLSQFADGELEGAFHMVRDEVLKGTPPIVFWDEFDSQAYKWLQYLLAPMQDGKFQSGQITHPIGKSIFIFAGGTSYTFETFGIEKPNKPDPKDSIALNDYEILLGSYTDFILKKGPDFKSRLSGYLNIQGPNQLEMLDIDGKIMKDADGNTIYNENDIQYPVRRALFIRGICKLKDEEQLNIDYGLLHALIKTRKYLHGSRSLEKILGYLRTNLGNKLQRSSLPSINILNMLVSKDFIGLLDEDKYFDFQAFKIAPHIHKNWINIGDTEGWKIEYHKDYNFLPAHMKGDNIAAARRIQKVLDTLKPISCLKIVSREDAEFYKKADFKLIAEDPTFMEKMAIEEHKGWMNTKELEGWKYSKDRNDDWKLHPCILEWESGKPSKLPVKEQDKDKEAVGYFSEVLKEAGFVIVIEKS